MSAAGEALVYVVDDDEAVRDALRMLLESAGHAVRACGGAEEFLTLFDPDAPCCVILDLRMPGTGGLQLQELLARRGLHPPIIFLTGHGDVPAAVRALKGGAVDFLQKPVADVEGLLDCVADGIRRSEREIEIGRRLSAERGRMARLTPREQEVMDQVCDGKANKAIAVELGISERTVELHRSRVMRKLGVRSVAELVKFRDRLRN